MKKIFTAAGGTFCVTEKELTSKIQAIKAFVFDWDGVFNNGVKHDEQGSPFSEIDSMGTNLLRFVHFLRTGNMPVVAIISGERNRLAYTLSVRENFHAVYANIKNKNIALRHMMDQYSVNTDEIAFVFDDVLDLSVAEMCRLRIMVNPKSSPLFKKYVIENNLADYITAMDGQNHAVRESCELCMGLLQQYESALEHRINFSVTYQKYLSHKEHITTRTYTSDGHSIIPFQQE